MRMTLDSLQATACIIVAATLLSAGCRNKTETKPPGQPAHAHADSTPAAPAAELPLAGIWTVTAHYVPEISGLTAEQADAWIGRSLRLSATEVVVEGARCDRPAFGNVTLSRDDFLGGDFNFAPGVLMRLADVDPIRLVDVSCNGSAFPAMGRLLVEVDPDHILAPFEGVYFELERDHDFRAGGQEPFWSLDIVKAKQLRLARPDHEDLVMPAPAVRTDAKTGRQAYHAATGTDDLLVVIEPTPCTDSTSENPFEVRVTVTLNGEVLRGCGGLVIE